MTKAVSTILIVDDESHNRKLLEAMLRPEGYVTFTAASGEEALAAVARQPPDLILLDVLMPGMDGYQVASKLKASPATSNIPVILVTGLVDRSARMAGLTAGAEEFLTKPIDKAELWVRVRNLLRLKSLGDFYQSHSTLLEEQVQERSAELHRFRAAMNTSADAIMLVSRASMRFVEVNATACLMFGYTAEQFSLLQPAILGAGTPVQLADAYDAIIAGDQTNILTETKLRRSDGSQFQAELRCHAHRSGADTILVSVVRDITARKKAVEDLRESEARFRSLSSLSSDWFWQQDDAHRFVAFSGGKTVEGWGPDQKKAVGLHRWDLGGVIPISSSWEEHKALLDAHEPFRDFEYERILDDGRLQCVEASGEPVFDADGRFTGYQGVATDITRRKHAEKRITRQNRVYAMLSGINSAMMRIAEREALFEETCRIAVSEGGFMLARVLELDAKGKARIVATTEGDPRAYQKLLDDYNHDPANCQNLVALALRSGQPQVSNDVAGDPRIPDRAVLTKDGSYALALLPFSVEHRVAGAIVLRAQLGNFDEVELQLLLELVGNLSFALEHIEKEAKVRRLTRVYAVLSGINTLIVHVRDRDELFHKACKIAVEEGGFRMAWIGIVDRSAMKIVPVASAGADAGFLAAAKEWLSLNDAAPGPSIMAVREKQAIVVDEVDSDARMQGRRGHLDPGVRSLVILPLMVDGEPIAVFGLHSLEPGYFDDKEMKLLRELGGDIAFAVDHLDKQAQLHYLAYYDELTGLANRTLFLERIEQHMRSAAAGGHKLAVFLFDLERFKNINDSLGQSAGDALLKQVAAWLTRYTGDATLVSRLGADHFAAVMPRVDPAGNLPGLLEKTVLSFLEHPFHLNDAVFRIAAKVGIAVHPDDAADADTLLKLAEAALKKAKADGDKFLFYTPQMTEKVAGKLTLENQLREALDNKEFVLHYQPKINLASGRLTGAEALIRWNDPRTGLVPPGRFIPILEETGLIYEVGRWALRQAIADYLRWRAAGLPAVRVAVNVSPLQLRNRGFIAEIKDVIGINPHAAAGLELEITESLIMEDVKHNSTSLRAIRDMGVTIAIDDFGTGFSSLSHLAKLPVDTLKIDRSFILDLNSGPQGLALVSTIISLAHAMKLKVVAEGVETAEQSRLLTLLNCDEMQGYLHSKPVPREVFEAQFLALPAAA